MESQYYLFSKRFFKYFAVLWDKLFSVTAWKGDLHLLPL
jgi:hypothetical protein